jgi:PAP2 superfamily protein
VKLRWWVEVLFVLAFYAVYSAIRNLIDTDVHQAFRHARTVIRVERDFGIFQEQRIEHWFIHWHGFMRFWNIYYGTFHFIVTVAVIVWLYRRFPVDYRRWRNVLAWTTALALVGYALYPLAPPRMMVGYGFQDSLKLFGSWWTFESGPVAKVSNQYAAMPSLHFAWASWCTFVLVPRVRRPWAKALAVAYPFITLFAIVVTANHFFLDAAGGAVILAAGLVLGTWWSNRSVRVPEVMLEEPGR